MFARSLTNAVFFSFFLASGSFAQSIEIQINHTAALDDDYLCWPPQPARARALGSVSSDIRAVISSEAVSATSTGQVQFQVVAGDSVSVDDFAPEDTLTLTLPASGEWVDFFVAGKRPSTLTKDVVVQARSESDGLPLGAVQTMVRVRKDARTMTTAERQLFLEVSRTLHDNGDFEKYYIAHEAAFSDDIHFMFRPPHPPLFLAWHRAFLLNFERELQEINPDVSLPYWKFDEPSFLPGEASIFSADFLGETQSSNPVVRFNDSLSTTPNPWHDWRVNRRTRPIERDRVADRAPFFGAGPVQGPIDQNMLSQILGASGNDEHKNAGGDIELDYHNGAHSRIRGWLGRGYSPADPLFFLLHANVDRAFAHWQERHDAWDATGTDAKSYHATGSYPGSGSNYLQGSYALDEMWPWNNTHSDWPSGMFFVMPDGPDGAATVPTPASQIDYLNLSGVGVASGACYDDIGYKQ